MLLPEYIEELYFKHFKKEPPKDSLSIEKLVKLRKQKRAERKERKRKEKANQTLGSEQATNPACDDIPF